MIDVTISIGPLPGQPLESPRWLVEVGSTQRPVRAAVAPITDEDLRAVPDLPAFCRTWPAFLTALSPGGSYSPGPAVLRAVGTRLYDRLLGSPEIAAHFEAVEARAKLEKRPIRFLLDLNEDDAALSGLPIELAYHSERFLFKRPARPAFRLATKRAASNLSLPPGSRVLIATAHSDTAAEPSRDALAEHAAALAAAVSGAGFASEHLPDASGPALRERLLTGEAVNLLYLACHGSEDRDQMGLLALRGGEVRGTELGAWLEEASELGRGVEVAVLCACSSAAPKTADGTLGMAQWLAAPGRAVASIGFRGPVLVPWALSFTETLFAELGRGAPIEAAFSEARWRQPDHEPQWPLPVLYCPRPDPGASLRRQPATRGETTRSLSYQPLDAPAARLLPSRLPRPPKPYFTGRGADLEALVAWAASPGAAVITAVQGQGGIGKSELALAFAHQVRKRGRSVVWLERPDLDPDGAVAALIALAQPNFAAPPNATREDLVAVMRRELGPFDGLLVLDDVADRMAVEGLHPGGGWNVLLTTRTHNLLPGVEELALGLLDSRDALLLLSRVAWSRDVPPDAEAAAAARLVERLGRLPLALELAGSTLRNLVTCEEYLASLAGGNGVAASDQERLIAVLGRSLRDLSPEDLEAFLALGVLPPVGSDAKSVATTLGQPVPTTTRRLDRLTRHSLAAWSPETGRYRLHPELRREAQSRLEVGSAAWQRLYAGAARAVEERAEWVCGPLETQVQLAWDRWRSEADWIDSIDPKHWLAQSAPNPGCIANALVATTSFRQLQNPASREAVLNLAEQLAPEANSRLRAELFWRRGELRRFRSDLDGAAADYNRALQLFQDLGNRLGQANVHQARGDLRLFHSDLDGAADDYDRALQFFQIHKSRLGEANVLHARGNLRLRRDDLNGAADDYNNALRHSEAVEDRLGQANVLHARGVLRLRRGDLDGADDFNRALQLFQDVRDRLGQARVLVDRGGLRLFLADFDGATADYNLALQFFQEVEDRPGQANTLKARGDLRLRRFDLASAAADYDLALDIFTKIESRLGQANVLGARGDLAKARQDLAEAKRWYQEAVSIYREVGANLGLSNVLAELSPVYLDLGEPQAATAALQEGLPLAEKTGNQYALQLFASVVSALQKLQSEKLPTPEEPPTSPPPE